MQKSKINNSTKKINYNTQTNHQVPGQDQIENTQQWKTQILHKYNNPTKIYDLGIMESHKKYKDWAFFPVKTKKK